MGLVLDCAPSGASGWEHIDFMLASPAYGVGSSSSVDFGTLKTSQFRQKAIELSRYQILVTLPEGLPDRFDSRPRVAPTMTTDIAARHPDLERAEARLSSLAQLDLNEAFQEVSALSEEVIREAGALLRKFAALDCELALPDLGLDADGTIVFSFQPERCGAIGSLSVFGDGTYSFYIEKDDRSVENGAALISGPIVQELQTLLTR